MKLIYSLLMFVVFLHANTIENTDLNNSVSSKVEKVIVEVSDTIKTVSQIDEADNMFQFLLFKMNEGFKSIGLYFDFFHLDTAKMLLIIIFLSLSWVLRYIISNVIEWKFSKNLKKEEDLVFRLVESVKIPMLWFLIVFSIHWSVKVLYYPYNISNNIESVFNTIQLFMGVWLFWNGLTNYSDIILKNKNKFKVEEIELIIITLKILLILISSIITIYTYWPDILKYVGGAGLVMGILMKDSFASYLAAFKLVTEKDFSIGDWISFSKGEGTIYKIGLFYTKVRAFNQSMILVPNSELIRDSVINYNTRIVRRIKFDFYLPINLSSAKISLILEEIRKMIKNHDGISSETSLSNDKKLNEERKLEFGFSDTLFVHLVNVEHGNKINVYAFTKKDEWKFQRDTKESIILEIKKILEEHSCSMIIEAKYLQNPFVDQNK